MKHDLNNKNFERKAKRVYSVFACVALLLVATAVPALAADDPLTVAGGIVITFTKEILSLITG